MLLIDILLFSVAFLLIWIGSGLIVSSTGKFAQKLGLSSFAFSFIFLGLLTSAPEFSVGLQSIADGNSEVFVGNLIGGIAVIFLLVIPLLAVFGKGINLKNELSNSTTLVTLAVVLLPSVFILDKRVSNLEGILLIVSYILLIFMVERKNGIFDNGNNQLLKIKSYSYKDILKILLGFVLIFISSSILVEKTLHFANLWDIPAFYISLVIVSLGTNLPEISLAVRSVFSGRKDIAMGDYLGSAAANTLLFGIFALLSSGEVITIDNFIITFIFIGSALFLFYFFSITNKFISRTNGLIMLGIYILFVLFELTS